MDETQDEPAQASVEVSSGEVRVAASVGGAGERDARLALKNGTAVEVPATALETRVEVELEELRLEALPDIAERAPDGAALREPVAFRPHGQTFEEPVRISIRVRIPDDSDAMLLRLDDEQDASWEEVREVRLLSPGDEGAGELAENERLLVHDTRHFSVYMAVALPKAPPTCQPGEFLVPNGDGIADDECAPCDAGTFSTELNATECSTWTDCSPGRYELSAPSASVDRECAACASGTYSRQTNADACQAWTVCAPGSFESTPPTDMADRVCEPCASGSFTSVSNATGCEPVSDCAAGQYVTEEPSSTSDRLCAACPVDSYSNQTNAPSCTAYSTCSAGSYQSMAPTPASDVVCTDCSAGDYCSGTDAPVVCADQGEVDHDGDPSTPCQPPPACGDDTYLRDDAANAPRCLACPQFSSSTGPDATSCDAVVPVLVELSMGLEFACGRTSTGEVSCWGLLGNQPSWPAPGTLFASLGASNGNHICGIEAGTQRAICWGDNSSGQTDAPAGVQFSEVTAGGNHSCGVRVDTGTIHCWGDDSFGQATPTFGQFHHLVAGADFTCGVDAVTSQAFCWGSLAGSEPASVLFGDLAAGVAHVCGIDNTNASVSCFGDNSMQQLDVPAEPFSSLALGAFHSCGVNTAGVLRCWGVDQAGETVPLTTPVTSLTAGNQLSCGLDGNGAALCSGVQSSGVAQQYQRQRYATVSQNDQYGCGLRSVDARPECWGALPPTTVQPADEPTLEIATHPDFTCAVRQSDGAATCLVFPIVDGQQVHGLTSSQVRAGISWEPMVCALRNSDNTAACDGANGGPSVNLGLPTDAPFSEIALGVDHVCAIHEASGVTECWAPAVNDGEASPPVGVALQELALGSEHSCALEQVTGRPVCWGKNDVGQASPPANLSLLSLSAYDQVTCGVRADDFFAQCWGPSNAPIVLATPPDVQFDSVNVGPRSACGVRRADGVLQCWGELVR